MEEARKLDVRPLLALAAIVAVALTLWAAGAFAAGGSSSSDPAGNDPAAAYIQTQDGNRATPGEDCPEDHGGRGGGSGDGSDSGGSGAGDL